MNEEAKEMKIVSINANDVKKMFKVCGACLDTDGVRENLQYIKIGKHAMRVDFMINDNKSVTMCDGATSLTTNYLVDYIGWEQVYTRNVPKQPVQIGIDAKMLAEILNSLKDYGYAKCALITIDADNATRPIFIETPDGSAKTMLCTCKVK